MKYKSCFPYPLFLKLIQTAQRTIPERISSGILSTLTVVPVHGRYLSYPDTKTKGYAMNHRYAIFLFLALLWPSVAAFAQTGKIAGSVVDQNQEPLIGVNVIIDGTTIGAVTDADGYFSILNVRPGTHTVRATFIGFTPVTVEDVRVAIELTTEVDISMQEAAVGMDEVVVTAEQPVIQRDIAASQRNIDAEDITSGKYQSIAQVLTAQVAFNDISSVEDRPEIRGSFFDESLYLVDGVNYNDPLTNQPHYRANLDAVQEIKVQTGGFSAEYGDVRSGVINVVTREGGERYSGSINLQYSPPGYKHLGPGLFDFNSPVVEPFVDPNLGAFTGNTFFNGWNVIAASLDEGEAHAGNPMELYARYLWRHRSEDSINELKRLQKQGIVQFADGVDPDDMVWQQTGVLPDYRIAATLGGPIPFFRPLKFFLSYNARQSEYAYRFVQPSFNDQNFRGKLTTNVGKGKKLNMHGYYGYQKGGNGGQGPRNAGFVSSNPFSSTDSENKYWNPNCSTAGDRTRQIYGTQWTHALSARTFYEVKLTHDRVDYGILRHQRNTAPVPGFPGLTSSRASTGSQVDEGRIGTEAEAMARAANGSLGWERWREWALIRIGEHWYDEAPRGRGLVGWSDVTGEYRLEGCRTQATGSNSRGWDANGSFTSQVNRSNQIRMGFQFRSEDITNYHEELDIPVNAGSVWDSQARQLIGAVYLQDKLEFQGFVATLGVRLDVLNTGDYPTVLDGCDLFGDRGTANCTRDAQYGPFSEGLSAGNTTINVENGSLQGNRETIVTETLGVNRRTHLRLSPRIGLSHPISTVAKIFMNYGHFHQWANAVQMYRLGMNTTQGYRVTQLGNPLLQPERTIQYEVGYEQNLFDRMSLRMTGYYKDVNSEIGNVNINPLRFSSYSIPLNRNFRDVRGFEAFLELRRGSLPYLSGWVSANYLVESGAGYGYSTFHEDPLRDAPFTNTQVSSSDVRPILKSRVDFHLPDDFGGPRLGEVALLGGLNVSLSYTWRRGRQFTWNPAQIPLVEDNVRWRPYQRWDLRLTKALFRSGNYETAFYIDVSNLFNNRNMNTFSGSDVDANDTNWSWDGHKWWNTERRDYMESLGYTAENQNEDGTYDNTIGVPGDWDNDAIDMPAFTPWTFLESRDIFFGIRLNF